MSKDKLLNILDEKIVERRNKIKGVVHTLSKKQPFKPKTMEKTIKLLLTPSGKQSVKEKILDRWVKEITKILYDSKTKNDKKKSKNLFMVQKKKKNIIDQKRSNGAFEDSYIEYQSKGNADKILLIKEYLNIIKPHLSNIRNYNKEECKIQLMMTINFVTIKEAIIIHEMYIRSKKNVILTGYEKDEIVEEVELDLLTDPNVLLITEGGTTQVSHRYVEANNKYMNDYDENKELSYLVYLDANNLYALAMSQKQPVGDFKWGKMYLA